MIYPRFFRMLISFALSEMSTLALYVLTSPFLFTNTSIPLAPSTTWKLVTIMPFVAITKPLPDEVYCFSVPEDIGRCCLDCVCVEAMYSYAIE